jgi:hypothetical protein
VRQRTQSGPRDAEDATTKIGVGERQHGIDRGQAGTQAEHIAGDGIERARPPGIGDVGRMLEQRRRSTRRRRRRPVPEREHHVVGDQVSAALEPHPPTVGGGIDRGGECPDMPQLGCRRLGRGLAETGGEVATVGRPGSEPQRRNRPVVEARPAKEVPGVVGECAHAARRHVQPVPRIGRRVGEPTAEL